MTDQPIPTEVISRDVYERVLQIATVPATIFVIWLSWVIINMMFNPKWQQERRNRQIRKAKAERDALMAAENGSQAGQELQKHRKV